MRRLASRVVVCAGLLVALMGSCTTGPCGCSEPLNPATLVSGDGQSGAPGQALPQPVTAEVEVAGVTVWFRPAEGSGTAQPASVESDLNGRAATVWTVGTEPGIDTLYISIRGPDQVETVAVAQVSAP